MMLSPPPAMARKRCASSTASRFDGTSTSANPAISSLASVNGPSVTVTLPPDSRTCAPFSCGWSPYQLLSNPAVVLVPFQLFAPSRRKRILAEGPDARVSAGLADQVGTALEVSVVRARSGGGREHRGSLPGARLPVVRPLHRRHPRWRGHREVARECRDIGLVHAPPFHELLRRV